MSHCIRQCHGDKQEVMNSLTNVTTKVFTEFRIVRCKPGVIPGSIYMLPSSFSLPSISLPSII